MMIWKWGCNFGGMENPSHFEFLSDNNIVLGRLPFAAYEFGDLVAVTEGFTVVAIAQVTGDLQPITDQPDLEHEAVGFNIEFVDRTLVAPANLVELQEPYQLPIQAGNRRVRRQKHVDSIMQLWEQNQ